MDDPIALESNPGRTRVVQLGSGAEFFVNPPFLTACNFGASGPKEAHSTSLERSQPP